MKYSPQQYARAFHETVSRTAPAKRRQVIRDFLSVVAKSGSLSSIPEIVLECSRSFGRTGPAREVSISTPERLSVDTVARKIPFASKVRSVRDVRLKGGAVVLFDDVRIDNSIARRMKRVREALTK
jgi:F0F1-type ATP synthase delta subunit